MIALVEVFEEVGVALRLLLLRFEGLELTLGLDLLAPGLVEEGTAIVNIFHVFVGVQNRVSLQTLSLWCLQITLESFPIFQLYDSLDVKLGHLDLFLTDVDDEVRHQFAI